MRNLILFMSLLPTVLQAADCNLLDSSDWVKQYNACPSSPVAAYNAAVQLQVTGRLDEARKLVQQSRAAFPAFAPLAELDKDLKKPAGDAYALVAQLTESQLKTWRESQTRVFSGEPPARAIMPPLPQLTKDEFETTAQFKQRVAEAQNQREAQRQKMENDYAQSVQRYNAAVQQHNDLLAQDARELPARLAAKRIEFMQANINTVFGKPQLRGLNYNADEAAFYGELLSENGNFKQPVKISVPQQQARALRDNAASIIPQIDFVLENNRLVVKAIRVSYAGETYAANLTNETYSAPVMTAKLDDSKLNVAATPLSTIAPNKVAPVNEAAFFSEALKLEADPELAKLRQQQAELSRKQAEAQQQQALLAERARLKHEIAAQQQSLAAMGDVSGDFKGLNAVMTWSFKPAQPRDDTVMVIIGNRNYQKGVPVVHFAHNDARAMKDFAQNSLGLSAEDVIYEEDATKGVMEGIFQSTLPNRVKAGKKNVLVYFSGHGMAANDDASLLPVDARPNTASVTGYSRNTLMQQLASLGAETTVMLDACYTGTSKDGAPLIAGKPVFKAPKQAWVPENARLISASTGNQIAWMDDEHGHSLMTYFLLQGLQGSADANRDGQIESTEIAAYLKSHVNNSALKKHEQPQQPEVIGKNQVLVRY